MEDQYVFITLHPDKYNYMKLFTCPRCILPDQILHIDYFRSGIMAELYADYSLLSLEYERRWKTGEITSEVTNYTRKIINKQVTSPFSVKSLSDLAAGVSF
jgi:hypothetical protein